MATAHVVDIGGVNAAYEDKGIALIPDLFDAPMVDVVRSWLAEVVAGGAAVPATFQPEYEPDSTGRATTSIRKLRRLYWNDERFWRPLIDSTGVAALARAVVGAPVALTFHAAFLKPAGIGTPVAFHQDQALWRHDYPGAVNIWVALSQVGPHNGGLLSCPGSHRHGQLPHVAVRNHPWHPGVDWRAEGLAEPVSHNLSSGDALLWHRYLVHGSNQNRSASDRWAVVFVFVDRTPAVLCTTDRADF